MHCSISKKLFLAFVCIVSFILYPLYSLNASELDKNVSQDEHFPKFWIWLHPADGQSDHVLKERYKKYKSAGVTGLFFESDNEQHFRIAKQEGLETHRWMWIMNRGEKFIRENHPEWFAQNRKGESCFDHPPYVDYYRWLCPSRPEVVEYLKEKVTESIKKDYVDGIHLDYIRYSDVILAPNLWSVYGIEQLQEFPEYDYCYCEVCKQKFRDEYGVSVDSIEYPTESLLWKKFRYDAVTNIVKELATIAYSHDKGITAAVFPTPDIAKRLVRQDWSNWNLTAVYPMIYHGFYKEQTPWIGIAVKESLSCINNRFPLYAGLYIPDFRDNDDLRNGIKYALDAGADGISLFGEIDDDKLEILRSFKK